MTSYPYDLHIHSCLSPCGDDDMTPNNLVGMAALSGSLGALGFGALNAYALMTFSLLYVPCAATLATIKKETGSWGWTGLVAVFQIAVAWLVTFAVYHIGLLFA